MFISPKKPYFPVPGYPSEGCITIYQEAVLGQMRAIRQSEGGYTRESTDVVRKAIADVDEFFKQLKEIPEQ